MEDSLTADNFDEGTQEFLPIEDVDSSSIVIIHPGSLYLRIGLASDPVPKKILHAVARKRKSNKPELIRNDAFLLQKNELDNDKKQLMEDSCNRVAQILQSSLRSDGRKRFSDKRVASLNASVIKADRVPKDDIRDSTIPTRDWFETKADAVFGEDILYLNPESDYNVSFPLFRGEINLRPGVGGSRTAVLADLESIWSHAIKQYLEIPITDLSKYCAVVIIPALYKRSLVKHYMSLLLNSLGFGRAFVIQDHVAATFGAGLGYACVVDMGDQKTSISCVEDGISNPETRIHLDYGGADITQVFHYVLNRVGFPYLSCNPSLNRFDALLLRKLKEDNCHLDLDICGLAEKNFHVALPGDETVDQYTFYVSDECLLAPSAIFYPDLFELTSDSARKRVRFHTKNPGDSEDPHDTTYLTETSRKYTKAGDASTGEMIGNENDPTQGNDDELDIVNEDTNTVNSTTLGIHFNCVQDENILLPLDAAIRKSVESCSSEEVKRKMYSYILLVGGGLRFKGIAKYLQQRLTIQVPHTSRNDSIEVIVDPKEINSDMTTWKGAAILSCLESARELWIRPDEWQKFGQKLLREKAPFPWA